MKVPEFPETLQNGTISINETDYPALDIKVIPGYYSDPSKLGLNWTYVSFSPGLLELQLYFDDPIFVSSNRDDKDLLSITVYGYPWFVSAQRNYMKPGF